MSERPVLSAIRAILSFKGYATVPEIARVAGLDYGETLRRINKNIALLTRDRRNGRILGAGPQIALREELYAQGAFYREQAHDYGNTRGLAFNAHIDLRKKLEIETIGGGLGDSYPYRYVPDTPENRRALEADGCLSLESTVIDDRLWSEE